jgi:hypothetical protein
MDTNDNTIEEEQVVDNPQVKIKKHAHAKVLINKAKSMVDAADEQSHSCNKLLQDDLADYARAKEELNAGGLYDCVDLLSSLGHSTQREEKKESEVVFETGEGMESIKIQDIKSARVSSVLLGSLFGFASFMGLIYVASEKVGVTLDLLSVPSSEMTGKILTWFSGLLGSDNMYVGAGLLGLSTLLVTVLVYVIKSTLKARKNLKLASSELEKAESYIEKKYDCKLEMDKVDTHMKDAILTLKTYEVLLNEQKGKLQRILHIEGLKEGTEEYHPKSFLEIKETRDMIAMVREFLAVQMSEEGKLSGKSTLFLHRAKNYLKKSLDRFY